MAFNHTSAAAPEPDKLNILIQSPVLLGVSALVAGLISFVSYLSHRPAVHYKSPPFMGDMNPIMGANGFIFRPW